MRRVLDLAALVRDVPQVAILGVELLLRLRDRDVVLDGIVDRCLPIVQAVGKKPRILPRRDDRERRIERHARQLEPHLVVALARCAVGDGVGARLVRHVHLRLRDQRPRDARAQQVVGLVGGVRPQHREAVVLGELPPQVADDDFVGAALLRFALDPFQLGPLPQLGCECDQLHAWIPFLQPRQDDGRIETTGVREHDFPGRRHGRTVYLTVHPLSVTGPRPLSADGQRLTVGGRAFIVQR